MALDPNPESRSKEAETLEVAGRLEQPEIGRRIDFFREKLTSRLLWLFGGTVVLDVAVSGIASATGHDVSGFRDILREVLPAETGLLGAAIGYYFGERAAR